MRTLGAASAGIGLGSGGLAAGLTQPAAAVDTVLDDFEDGDLSEYSGHTSRYTVQGTTTLEGAQTLEATQTYGKIAHESATTPRGYEYRCRIMAGSGSAGNPGLLVSAQSPSNPWADCYYAAADADTDTLYLGRRAGGSGTTLASASVTINEGTEYRLAIDLDTDTLTAVLYDSSNTELAATTEVTDTTHTGGTVGFYGGGGTPAYFDYVGQTALAEPPSQTAIFEDFETGTLGDDYTFDTGSTGASVVASPVYHESNALELAGTTVEMISTPEALTLAQGDSITYRVRATGGANLTHFTYGVQDHGNRYFVRVAFADDGFELQRYEGGSSTDLDVTTTSSPLAADTWYDVELEWSEGGVHTATLFDQSGTQLAQVSATDTTWDWGHVGFDAYLGSGEAVYYDYLTTEATPASFPHVIDDFEDTDLTEDYTFENNNESAATLVSSPTRTGGQALELSGAHCHLNGTAELPYEPAAGDVFGGWVRASSDIDGSLVLTYGVQDFENRYYAYVDVSTGTIRIRKKVQGTITTLAEQTGLGLSPDTWYELEVDWRTDGTHIFTLYDTTETQLGQVSVADDRTWQTGTVGYNAHVGNGASGYFDYVCIKETSLLGEFEGGLDGWSSDSSVQFSRMSVDEQPAAVTQGNDVLKVRIDSDPEPAIRNEEYIQQADLTSTPYLVADVLPASVENSDSPVKFRFEYHYSNPGGIEHSPTMNVDQRYGGRLGWDMSGLSTTKLNSPKRLEIVWYPTDHPPSKSFDYNGVVYVDNIRLTRERNLVTNARWARKQRDMERAYGPMTDQVITSQNATRQDGYYEFSNGGTVAYYAEVLQNGNIRETCDGDTFVWEVSQ